MPSVEWNQRAWNEKHEWASGGDEWSGMAAHSGVAYDDWKRSLVETFIDPHIGAGCDALEIAPGHGRWTASLAGRVASLTLVDLNPGCIEACRTRFASSSNVRYVVNDGATLPGVANESIDFVWSFDSFVHMELDVVDSYLAEISRVLRPGGVATLHHADKRPWSLRLVPITRHLGKVGKSIQGLASQGMVRRAGNRGNLSKDDVARCANSHGVDVELQTSKWGPDGIYTVDRFHDCISVLRKGYARHSAADVATLA